MFQAGGGIVIEHSLGATRRHDGSQESNISSTSRFGDTEWEAKESQRQRELDEARARAAQMEKTMKWWSDCTANWREKWCKVRNERNSARDEVKQLRTSLETAVKDSNSYKREKVELEMQVIQLKKEVEKIHLLLMTSFGTFHKSDLENGKPDNREISCSLDASSDGLKNVNSENRLEALHELLTLQKQHREEVRILNNSLQEEITSRENLERKLCELRTELERLQVENASEWGKRERLETAKLCLERDNKKLRAEIKDLEGKSDKNERPVSNVHMEIGSMQTELAGRNKEIYEVKHSHAKLKKLLAETNTELGHAVRRAEQYEAEVKILRTRVEELKRELENAENELDATSNQFRRLQRTNEDLTAQTESLQIQIQHLQTRLHSYGSTGLLFVKNDNSEKE